MCGAEARASVIKESHGSTGTITHAGAADDKDGGNGELEVAENVPAEKSERRRRCRETNEQGNREASEKGNGLQERERKRTGGARQRRNEEKAVRPRNQRLVSYSSQEMNSQDDTGSRRSTRKRTAASNRGSVMIDAITRDEGKGKLAPTEKGRVTA